MKNIIGKTVGTALDTDEGKRLIGSATAVLERHKKATAIAAAVITGCAILRPFLLKWYESKTKRKEIRLKKQSAIETENLKHRHLMTRISEKRKKEDIPTPQTTPDTARKTAVITNDDIRQAAHQPRPQLIAGQLEPRQLNMLYGLQSSGKTLLAHHWSILHCQASPSAYALYIDTEPDLGALYSRYLARGFDFPPNFRRINAQAYCHDAQQLADTIREETTKAVEQLGMTDVLITVDNLSSPRYRLGREKQAALLCDTLSALINRWPQPVSITILLLMHLKHEKNGTIEDADTNKFISRTAHGPAYLLTACGNRIARLTAVMDNNAVATAQQMLTIVEKPYLHHQPTAETDIRRLMRSRDVTALVHQLYSKGMKQEDIVRLTGLKKQNVSNRLKSHPAKCGHHGKPSRQSSGKP
ncbi:MAG: AAA family ATPase [Prevotella sp.]|nr:AAA family ATPase [Prevotella sp.]